MAMGTPRDTLKSTISSTRQPRIGQCAGKDTIERMARGHEVTSDAYTVRARWKLSISNPQQPRA